MSNLKIVSDDQDFEGRIKSAGHDLVVVDFYTTWCGPCKKMEGAIISLAMKYPSVLFLKVDADQCFETAMNHDLKGVPLFVLYRNMEILDQVQGAQPQVLDAKILAAEADYRRRYSSSQTDEAQSSYFTKSMASVPDIGPVSDVTNFLDVSGCRVINDLTPSSFDAFLSGKKLISGKGSGKLLVVYTFKEKLILHSFVIKAKADSGPKVLRFFANHPKVLDFHVAGQLAPSQEVTLCPDDLSGERAIEFRAGGFNLVTNLQIFVASVMSTTWKPSGYHRVELDSLKIYGAPVIMKEKESLKLPISPTPFSLPHQSVCIGMSTSASIGESSEVISSSSNNDESLVEDMLHNCAQNEEACSIKSAGIELLKNEGYADPPKHHREIFGHIPNTTDNYPGPPPGSQPKPTTAPFGGSSIQQIITENLKNLRMDTPTAEVKPVVHPQKNTTQNNTSEFIHDSRILEDLKEEDKVIGHDNVGGKSKSRQISKASSIKSNNANDVVLPSNKGTVSSLHKAVHTNRGKPDKEAEIGLNARGKSASKNKEAKIKGRKSK